MSRHKIGANLPAEPPFIGALLRLCWQRVRRHIYQAVRDAGFTDLDEAHFSVFSYPLPHGVRPSQLARQLRMSRQATNYLIGQLEALGYVERRAGSDQRRRLVYLTDRGQRVADVIYRSLRQLQKQWGDQIGPDRFKTFLEVLKFFSANGEP
jgi:DNA-binding MarR family transcriptional regulator